MAPEKMLVKVKLEKKCKTELKCQKIKVEKGIVKLSKKKLRELKLKSRPTKYRGKNKRKKIAVKKEKTFFNEVKTEPKSVEDNLESDDTLRIFFYDEVKAELKSDEDKAKLIAEEEKNETLVLQKLDRTLHKLKLKIARRERKIQRIINSEQAIQYHPYYYDYYYHYYGRF